MNPDELASMVAVQLDDDTRFTRWDSARSVPTGSPGTTNCAMSSTTLWLAPAYRLTARPGSSSQVMTLVSSQRTALPGLDWRPRHKLRPGHRSPLPAEPCRTQRGYPRLFPQGCSQPEDAALQGKAPAAGCSILSSCLRFLAQGGTGPDQEGCGGPIETHRPGGEYGRFSPRLPYRRLRAPPSPLG